MDLSLRQVEQRQDHIFDRSELVCLHDIRLWIEITSV